MWVTLLTWLENALRWIRAGWPTDYLPPLVALAAFLLSLWTYRSAKQRERFKLGIDSILKLGERFGSEVMLVHRAAAANALMAGDINSNLSVDEVFDFFEDVGFCFVVAQSTLRPSKRSFLIGSGPTIAPLGTIARSGKDMPSGPIFPRSASDLSDSKTGESRRGRGDGRTVLHGTFGASVIRQTDGAS